MNFTPVGRNILFLIMVGSCMDESLSMSSLSFTLDVSGSMALFFLQPHCGQISLSLMSPVPQLTHSSRSELLNRLFSNISY